ncbi:MAG: CPBP family intramembrane metalloprotease [Bacilli bacterium]|nr:CPBP family intramembrane metalloprotease [Bacilli bacterium]
MKVKIIVIICLAMMVILDLFDFSLSNSVLNSYFIQGSLSRGIGAILVIYLLYVNHLKSFIAFHKVNMKISLILIPAFLVAINNFPFFAYLSGRTTIFESNRTITLFLIFMGSLAVFEELVFRGVVLNLLRVYLPQTKKGLFIAIIFSSTLFSFMHILNLFSGASIGNTMLQIGYTFLTGMMFAMIYILTKNIWISIMIHFIYNVGGLLFVFNGTIQNQWDTPTIMVTFMLAVCTMIFYLVIFFKSKSIHLKNNI